MNNMQDTVAVIRELNELARSHETTIQFFIDLVSMRVADIPISVMGKLGQAANLIEEAKNEYKQSISKDTASANDSASCGAR